MSWRLVLRRRAVREATQAHDWYEAQREGLAERVGGRNRGAAAENDEAPGWAPAVRVDRRRVVTPKGLEPLFSP